jgi:hypothetical protein
MEFYTQYFTCWKLIKKCQIACLGTIIKGSNLEELAFCTRYDPWKETSVASKHW